MNRKTGQAETSAQRRRVIVIGSCGEDLDAFRDSQRGTVIRSLSGGADFNYVALSEPTTRAQSETAPASYCAAVVLLTRSMVHDASWLRFMQSAVKEAASRVDFRLFVCFCDLSLEEFWGMAPKDDGLLAAVINDLVENVQVTGITEISAVVTELNRYLETVEHDTRTFRTDLAKSERMERIASWLGYLRAAVPLGILLLVWISRPDSQKTGLTGILELRNAMSGIPGMGFVWGVFSASVSVPLLYFLSVPTSDTLNIRGFTTHLAMATAVIVFTVTLLAYEDFAKGWWGVGFLVGWLLEAAFRERFRHGARLAAMRSQPKYFFESEIKDVFDKNIVATQVGGGIASPIYEAATKTSDNYVRCPVFTSVNEAGSVFVSYSRRSAWSTDRAKAIADEFRSARIPCFLDRDCIPEGSSWRHHIYKHIHCQTLFITMLDEITEKSKWAAAELESALWSVSYVAAPQVAIVSKPDYFQEEDKSATLPVFGTVLARLQHHSDTDYRAPFRYTYSESTWPAFFELMKSVAWLRIGLFGTRISQAVYLLLYRPMRPGQFCFVSISFFILVKRG